jgi:hypothetical protein
MPIRPKKLQSILETKFRFKKAEGHSSDHYWYELKLEGIPKILTKVSHSRDPISPKIESMIARQLRVKKSYFVGMVSCENSREDYYQQIIRNPIPPFDINF